ncbi:MAG: hypothetical protein ACJAS6_000174 [Rickettsiales bacterium]|jgi:hypothetical protein
MIDNNISSKTLNNPYYIVAPSFTKNSAGVLALHLLCHHLNMKGYPSFITGFGECNYKTKPGLITPILDEEIITSHNENKKNPIVIYPDIAKGNPLNANNIVRYLLNYAGLLGGDSSFSQNDMIFSYTKRIAQQAGFDNHQILFMPISNTDIFYPPKDNKARKGSCFYASKYKSFHKGKLFDITKDSVEITRDLPNSQTTQEVADLLRKSEIFYTYEDSSLITEAILCGCPVVLIKNEFFDGETLAKHELGIGGCSKDVDPKNIEYAKQTISLAQEQFIKSVDNFWAQLDNFIKITQDHFLKSSFEESEGELLIKLLKKKRNPIGRIIKQQIMDLIKSNFK